MKRYIEIFLGGRRYRFLIDDELDKELRNSLNSRYQFDSNNILLIDDSNIDNSYQVKQLILKSILNKISKYDLDENLQKRINDLKDYDNSDLTKLESILIEASEIYKEIGSFLAKKDIEEKKGEFKGIFDDISYDEVLRKEVPINDIKDAIDRIIICSSMDEFIEKTNNNGTYDIIRAIKNKNEKIILPPNSKLEDVIGEVLKILVSNQNTLDNLVKYVDRKTSYQNKINKALEFLQNNLKSQGLSAYNLNYFGEQFFNEFESICKDTGISFEAMFDDYFNSYSEIRKYNSPMDKFIRTYSKYNGEVENTTALLEAMFVKKAISRHLISPKYNNYLKEEYRSLNVNSNGYVNFNENSFITNSNSQAGVNNNVYGTEFRIAKGGINRPLINDTDKNSVTDALMLQSSLAINKKNKANNGVVIERTSGQLNTTEMNSLRRTMIAGVNRPFTTNNSFNPLMLSHEEIDEEDNDEIDEINEENSDNYRDNISDFGTSLKTSLNDNKDKVDDINNNIENSNNPIDDVNEAVGEAIKNKAKDAAKKAIIEFIKNNPWVIAVIGGIIFIIILILIIAAYQENKNNQLGYYDAACNFNDTKVALVSCKTDEVLQTLEIKDYVVRMTYLYTKDSSYSDEAIKALMIILKTNALAMGSYNSSNKNVSVRVCDAYTGVIDETTIFSGVEDKLTNLNSLYDNISEYLFVSSSYKSSISSLGSANVIPLNNDILSSFEEKASNGNTYSEILSSLNNNDNTEDNVIYRDTLYIGDARTLGMLNASYINQNNTVYGDGYGYNWLVGSSEFDNSKTNAHKGAINGINAKIRNNASYNIVIWLGFSDLNNINSYIEKYKELATGDFKNHNIYIVSVGPVLDSSLVDIKNEDINSFNNLMREAIDKENLSNLKFIDLGNLTIDNYDSTGILYSNTDYKNIYDIISSNLQNEISSNLVLYRLSDYCTYYNLTENDAYWWPIGSKEATEGNIYGGMPVNSTITSTFGPRIHPITGVKQRAHGAIDIAVPRNTPIIATKSGTVKIANTGCSEGDLDCGGGYGNYIKLDHGEGVESLYAHLTSLVVKKGDFVNQGQIIAYSGTTGRSTGPHLHFEIRLNGTKVDPVNYVSADNPRPTNSLNPNITGSSGDNKNMVCSSLLSSGFSKDATIGIMANLYAESSYNPINLEGTYENKLGYTDSSYTLAVDNGTYKNFTSDAAGYGIVQWTSPGRKLNLYNFAKEKNTSIGNFGTQFEFMLKELESNYSNTYKYITSNHTAVEIGAYWCDHYESPRGSEVCSYNGNCPSQYCVNRTNNSIDIERLTEYVNNGCKY